MNSTEYNDIDIVLCVNVHTANVIVTLLPLQIGCPHTHESYSMGNVNSVEGMERWSGVLDWTTGVSRPQNYSISYTYTVTWPHT